MGSRDRLNQTDQVERHNRCTGELWVVWSEDLPEFGSASQPTDPCLVDELAQAHPVLQLQQPYMY